MHMQTHPDTQIQYHRIHARLPYLHFRSSDGSDALMSKENLHQPRFSSEDRPIDGSVFIGSPSNVPPK